jgi:ADP-ribose pyrophosphatase YjhB (NUDIX family)
VFFNNRGESVPQAMARAAHEKTRVSQTVRENTSFSQVVDILENAQMAGTGFELVVVFRGKSYILSAAGDKLGIISARETR